MPGALVELPSLEFLRVILPPDGPESFEYDSLAAGGRLAGGAVNIFPALRAVAVARELPYGTPVPEIDIVDGWDFPTAFGDVGEELWWGVKTREGGGRDAVPITALEGVWVRDAVLYAE